jgi:metallo-beta-lactamase class B
MKKEKLLIFIVTALLLIPGKKLSSKINTAKQTISNADTVIVYKSDILIIQKLSAHVYQHISFLNSKTFGRVDCNGMVVLNENEAVIFDTPANDESSAELINYLSKTHNYTITAIIPTHFHEDCVGGLEKFNEYSIPCYASNKTIELLKNKGRLFSKPIQGFNKRLTLHVGGKKVYVRYFGQGHTKDNVVGYFPDDKAVFGGCLIKEVGAGKGNLEDANVAVWPQTVSKVKRTYREAKIVIPGHGKTGGTELFDYTIKLFISATNKAP